MLISIHSQALLINGNYIGPTIRAKQGETFSIKIVNNISDDYPVVASGGVNIHIHGFEVNGLPWLDGAAHTNSCPIARNFSYSYVLQEPPGTYFWHGHNGVTTADGLRGPLIVDPPGGPEFEFENIINVADWWAIPAGQAAKGLNRPFDASRQTAESGNWTWVGNPNSILLNGKGCRSDCSLPPNSTAQVCMPQPDCPTRYVWEVESNKTYLVRVINSGSLVYQTLCFEGHNLTVIATDARPVEPRHVGSCVDVNMGQRVDALLTTDAEPGVYWINSLVQLRAGNPAGYGVLRYTSANTNQTLPETPPLQPSDAPSPWPSAGQFLGTQDTPKPPRNSSRLVMVQMTQPLLYQTGQLRWAMDNVVNLNTPSCSNILSLTGPNMTWLADNTVQNPNEHINNSTLPGIGEQAGSGNSLVFMNMAAMSENDNAVQLPTQPVAGVQLIRLLKGDVVDVVLQNSPANALNGDYRTDGGLARNAQEQHPIHLHGHSFWVLGSGNYTYNPANATHNLENPQLRDTITLQPNGWVWLRFVANNPGVWPMHCHIIWHQFMGQELVFLEAREEVGKLPDDLPVCPDTCIYNAAPWLLKDGPPSGATRGNWIPSIVLLILLNIHISVCLLQHKSMSSWTFDFL